MNTPTWLIHLGFVCVDAFRKPTLGEWYVNKNNDSLCYVYDDASLPCDCPKCGGGERQIIVPIPR